MQRFLFRRCAVFCAALWWSAVLPVAAQTSADLLFAGTLQHGIWKSFDQGLNWSPTGAGPDAPWGPTLALLIDPRAPQTLYAAGSGLYRSTDSGFTWTSLYSGDADPLVLTLALHPTDSRILMAGTLEEGIWSSTDGGATWRTTLSGQTITSLAIGPNREVYAGGPSGLYKSNDGGAVFQKTDFTHAVNALLLDPEQPETLYMAGDGLFKTVNGAQTWTQLACSCASGSVFTVLARNGSTLLAGGMDLPLHALVLQSSNAGTTWSALPVPETDAPQAFAAFPGLTLVGAQGPGNLFRNTAGTWDIPEGWPTEAEVTALRAATISAPPPTIFSVTPAPGGSVLQPNAWASIFGLGLAPSSRAWQATEIVNGMLPVQLDGVSVQVNGIPAPLFFISPGQLNFLVPSSLLEGTASVTVTNGTGTSALYPIQLQPTAPVFFTLSPPLQKYVVATFPDGRLALSARPGDTLILWSTGCGLTNPPVDSARLLPAPATTAAPVTVTLGQMPARVLFSGMTGVGLCQFNVILPEVAAGDQLLEATLGGVPAQTKVYLKIER